tara:strand:+ start:22372 stop:23043 length:672 start_codon:yes stop_codon:yes gene_type:complete
VNRLATLCLAAFAAGVMAVGAGAQSGEREVGPLPRLFPHWQDYLDLPADDRSHFTLAYVIGSNRGVTAEDIRLWYVDATGETVLELAPDGQVLNPPDAETLQAAPMLWVNQPQGGMSVSMSFQASLGSGSEIDRLDTLLALEQANQAMRRTGGVASLFAPAFKTLIFVFDGTAPDAWAIRTDGSRTPLVVQEDRATYRPNDRDMRDVERLVFGRAPMRILLDS